jgi:uncharacterized membrane protein HdeD (DUF308 family)
MEQMRAHQPNGTSPAAEADGPAGFLGSLLDWRATMAVGVVTVILGIIVTALPEQSLKVIAVLLGVLMLVSGLYHLVSVFGSGEQQRLWHGIAGLLFIAAGVILIRHLSLTLAFVGLVIGFTWIIQGVSLLLSGASGRLPGSRGWTMIFGVISLIAGIVVVASPISSVTVLAVLTGIWFIVMGLMEVFAAMVLRREVGRGTAVPGVPGPRAGDAAGDVASEADQTRAR